jgi:prepilin-type N-terminal cleavage/methylation domain-containing protein
MIYRKTGEIKMSKKADRRGFTLIELLVVVAIIAIVSSIAIVNFMAAQTRSKVARVKSELNMVTTAIESYYVDNNAYPLTTGYAPLTNEPIGILPNQLSTPIGYITNVRFRDPFGSSDIIDNQQIFTYQNIPEYIQNNPNSNYWPIALQVYGDWRICSIGPDRDYYNGGVAPSIQYDPSNGTSSVGNIWVGQKGFNPPTGPIYGTS